MLPQPQYLKQWQQIITNKTSYQIVEPIGQGNFGVVFRALDQNSQTQVAIKQVPYSKLQDEQIRKCFEREVEIHQKIDNKNVVKLYEFYDHAIQQSYLLIMRYCPDGDLAQKIAKEKDKHFNERSAINYFKQILNGFLGLHQQGIIHRDIKPTNIFLDKETALIGDFGFATKVKQGQQVQSQVGTFSYMAPEIFSLQPYNYSVDIYSLGVLLYFMLYGEVPFQSLDSNPTELFQQVKVGKINFNPKIRISIETQNLIKRMLAYDPKERVTWKEMCQMTFLNSTLQYPEEEVSLAILEGGLINKEPIFSFYESEVGLNDLKTKQFGQLEKIKGAGETNAKYPNLSNLSIQPNQYNQEKEKQLQIQQQQQLQLQQQQQYQLKKQQEDQILLQNKTQAILAAQKKEDQDFNIGMKKYLHLRNCYGNLIRILNDINTLSAFKINYQIPAFMTAKKIIQQIKRLLKIVKEKQNIFKIEPFNKFAATNQYIGLQLKCETDLGDMRKEYPKLLQECRDSIQRLRLTHPPLLQQLGCEDTDGKFEDSYKECLTNYSLGLREQCTHAQTEDQRNLFCHLILVSEIIQFDKFAKDDTDFDFSRHKEQIRNTPFQQFDVKLDEGFQRIFS